MRIMSNGEFDPLCPSPLLVANAHTLIPRPALGNSIDLQMRCDPCSTPVTENGICCRNCFYVEMPDITITAQDYCGTEISGDGYLNTDGGAFVMAGCEGASAPCGGSDWTGQCVWSYSESRDSGHGPSSGFSLSLRTTSETDAFLIVVFTPSSGAGVSFIQAGYFSTNFSCSGGTFTKGDIGSPEEMASCVGTNANWPDTLEVTGAPCS